jgi:hypothetical protein
MKNVTIKVCFVIETTSEMTEILPNVQSYVEETITTLPYRLGIPSAEIFPAAILYRDYDDPDHLSMYDFRTADEFFEDLPNLQQESRIACFGKSDAADVAGAVHAVLEMNWDDADVKIVVHCGVTPAHGRMFDDVKGRLDKYPGENPSGHDLLEDMYTLSRSRVQYMFVRISERVDTMLELFRQVYDLPGTFRIVDCPRDASYTSEPDSVGE